MGCSWCKTPTEYYDTFARNHHKDDAYTCVPNLSLDTPSSGYRDGILGHVRDLLLKKRNYSKYYSGEYIKWLITTSTAKPHFTKTEEVKFLKRFVTTLRDHNRTSDALEQVRDIPGIIFALLRKGWISPEAIDNSHSHIQSNEMPFYVRARTMPVKEVCNEILQSKYWAQSEGFPLGCWPELRYFPFEFFQQERVRTMVNSSFYFFNPRQQLSLLKEVPFLRHCLSTVNLDSLWSASRLLKKDNVPSKEIYRQLEVVLAAIAPETLQSTSYRYEKMKRKIPTLCQYAVSFIN